MAVFDCELRLPAFLVVLFALGFSAALVCASEGNVLIPAIAAVTGGLCCGAAFLALSAGAGQAASTQTALISRVCRLEAEVAAHIPGAVIRNPEMAPPATAGQDLPAAFGEVSHGVAAPAPAPSRPNQETGLKRPPSPRTARRNRLRFNQRARRRETKAAAAAASPPPPPSGPEETAAATAASPPPLPPGSDEAAAAAAPLPPLSPGPGDPSADFFYTVMLRLLFDVRAPVAAAALARLVLSAAPAEEVAPHSDAATPAQAEPNVTPSVLSQDDLLAASLVRIQRLVDIAVAFEAGGRGADIVPWVSRWRGTGRRRPALFADDALSHGKAARGPAAGVAHHRAAGRV